MQQQRLIYNGVEMDCYKARALEEAQAFVAYEKDCVGAAAHGKASITPTVARWNIALFAAGTPWIACIIGIAKMIMTQRPVK